MSSPPPLEHKEQPKDRQRPGCWHAKVQVIYYGGKYGERRAECGRIKGLAQNKPGEFLWREFGGVDELAVAKQVDVLFTLMVVVW